MKCFIWGLGCVHGQWGHCLPYHQHSKWVLFSSPSCFHFTSASCLCAQGSSKGWQGSWGLYHPCERPLGSWFQQRLVLAIAVIGRVNQQREHSLTLSPSLSLSSPAPSFCSNVTQINNFFLKTFI